MRLIRLAATIASLVVIVGCGGSSSGGGADRLNPSRGRLAPQAGVGHTGCTAPPTAKPKRESFDHEPNLTIDQTTYTATIVTNCGTIVVALDGRHAPHTVNSFAFLAGKHYFDNTPCHRLTTQGIYVLQCGDPTGSGNGGPGYTIPDENLAHATYPAGTVAMANTGQPHSGGSQFFLVYADTSLPPAYAPFGRVVSGLDVLRAIAKAGEDDRNGPGDGAPTHPVVIESFTVVKAG